MHFGSASVSNYKIKKDPDLSGALFTRVHVNAFQLRSKLKVDLVG